MSSVFVSRTSDMATYPADRPYAEAAIRGIIRAGRTPVDMEYFAARDERPAAYCRQRVLASAVYVAVIGFRYGSLVPKTDYSYTDLEFRTATDAGIPRLVFLLDDDAPIPRRLVDRDATAVDAFRDRLRKAGVISHNVDSPAELEMAVYQALSELDPVHVLDTYRAALISRYQNVDLEILDGSALVPLRSVFVPQRVGPDGSSVLDVVAGPDRCIVLLGDPGAGKSTLARYVTLTLADSATLPTLIELRSYAPWAREDSLLAYLERQYRTEGTGLPQAELVRYLDGGGPALLVCDGLDELFDARLREGVTRQIAATAARWPSLRVLVTSRIAGYRRSLLDHAGFVHFQLQNYDDAQIDEFVRAYDAEHLLDTIRSSPSVRELAGNPLLLAILASSGELPERRLSVYAHAASVLVERWDVDRHLRDVRVEMDYVDRNDRFELLRRVAARVQSGAVGNLIPHADLLAEFRTYLAERYALPPHRTKIVATAMIDQFVERNFVLRRVTPDRYGFVHRAFLEYFAATEILCRSQEAPGVFRTRWHDPEWREVLVLVAGALDEQGTEEVLADLLDADPLWWLRHPAVPRHLCLAVACLAEGRRTGVVAERVIRALTDALTHEHADFVLTGLSPSWPGREHYREWYRTAPGPSGTAIRVLAALFAGDDEALELLKGTAPATAAAVEAVADHWTASPGVRDWLARRASAGPAPVRAAALRGLARHWPLDAEDVLGQAAVGDASASVRRQALESLVTGWPDDPRTWDLVYGRAVLDVAAEPRLFAVRTIAQHRPREPSTEALLTGRVRTEPDSLVGTAAAAALRELWNDSPDAREALRAYDAKPAQATEVVEAALEDDTRTDSTALTAIRGVLDDRWLGPFAVHALASRWPDDPDTFSALVDLAGTVHNDTRSAVVDVLGTHWPGRPGVRALVADRAVADTDFVVRRTALARAVQTWPDGETRRLLLDRATRDRHADVRILAARILAALSSTQWPVVGAGREP